MIKIFPILLPALLLAACAADLSEHDYRISHPLNAEQKAAVAVFDRPSVGELSAFDRERLARLAAESLRRGAGGVEVGCNDPAFAAQLAEALRQDGITDVRIVAGKGEAAEIRVPVWAAVVPECGTFERGLNPDPDNAPHSNWGCSTQRNIGLMVQNPADLIRARAATGRSGARASDVLGKYEAGQATGSAQEAIKSGTTSAVATGGGN